MTTDLPDPVTNLDGLRTDIDAHRAELPTDVVDCVGCHIAVNDVPALIAELERTRALVKAARAWRAQFEKPADTKLPRMRALIDAVDELDRADLARDVAQHQRALLDRIRPKAQP